MFDYGYPEYEYGNDKQGRSGGGLVAIILVLSILLANLAPGFD